MAIITPCAEKKGVDPSLSSLSEGDEKIKNVWERLCKETEKRQTKGKIHPYLEYCEKNPITGKNEYWKSPDKSSDDTPPSPCFDAPCPKKSQVLPGMHASWVEHKKTGVKVIASVPPRLMEKSTREKFFKHLAENNAVIMDLEDPLSLDAKKTSFVQEGYHRLKCSGWSDSGPNVVSDLTNLVAIFKKVIESGHLLAVHCEDGVGRTGTLLTAYIIHRMVRCGIITKDNYMDQLHNLILSLREQRGPRFVRNLNQFTSLVGYVDSLLKSSASSEKTRSISESNPADTHVQSALEGSPVPDASEAAFKTAINAANACIEDFAAPSEVTATKLWEVLCSWTTVFQSPEENRYKAAAPRLYRIDRELPLYTINPETGKREYWREPYDTTPSPCSKAPCPEKSQIHRGLHASWVRSADGFKAIASVPLSSMREHTRAWFLNYLEQNNAFVIDLEDKPSSYAKETISDQVGYSHMEIVAPNGQIIHGLHCTGWPGTDVKSALSKRVAICEKVMELGYLPVIHCEDGVGWTGTLLAACMIRRMVMRGEITKDNYGDQLLSVILSIREQRGPHSVGDLNQFTSLLDYTHSLIDSHNPMGMYFASYVAGLLVEPPELRRRKAEIKAAWEILCASTKFRQTADGGCLIDCDPSNKVPCPVLSQVCRGIHANWIKFDGLEAIASRSPSWMTEQAKTSFFDYLATKGNAFVLNLTNDVDGYKPYAKHTPCVQKGYTHMEIVTSSGQIIHGLNYTGWPDRGTNIASLLPNLVAICEKVIESGGLLVVHCNAGVGRTGTLLIACIILRMVRSGKITKANYMVQIHNLILFLREQRGPLLVRDLDQYESLIDYTYNLLTSSDSSKTLSASHIADQLVQPAHLVARAGRSAAPAIFPGAETPSGITPCPKIQGVATEIQASWEDLCKQTALYQSDEWGCRIDNELPYVAENPETKKREYLRGTYPSDPFESLPQIPPSTRLLRDHLDFPFSELPCPEYSQVSPSVPANTKTFVALVSPEDLTFAPFADLPCPVLSQVYRGIHANWIKFGGFEAIASLSPSLMGEPTRERFFDQLAQEQKRPFILNLTNKEADNLPPYAIHTPCAQEGYSQMKIVTSDGEIIHGLNYTGWPDRDSNVASLLPDLVLTCEKVIESGGLLVVHCRAGIGRTGTLLTACIIRRMVMSEEITKYNYMDKICELILFLREQRGPFFIRGVDQYVSLIDYVCSILDLSPDSVDLFSTTAEPGLREITIQKAWDTLCKKTKDLQRDESINTHLKDSERNPETGKVEYYDASSFDLTYSPFDDVPCPRGSQPLRDVHANEITSDGFKAIVSLSPSLMGEPTREKFLDYLAKSKGFVIDLSTEKELNPYAKTITPLEQGYSRIEIDASDGQTIPGLKYGAWPGDSTNVADALPNLVAICEKVIESGCLLVVHCRAGIGRAGILLTACIIRRMVTSGKITKDNYIDQIGALILSLRKQRGPNFVRGPDQFALLMAYAEHLLYFPGSSKTLSASYIAHQLVQPAASSAAASSAAASSAAASSAAASSAAASSAAASSAAASSAGWVAGRDPLPSESATSINLSVREATIKIVWNLLCENTKFQLNLSRSETNPETGRSSSPPPFVTPDLPRPKDTQVCPSAYATMITFPDGFEAITSLPPGLMDMSTRERFFDQLAKEQKRPYILNLTNKEADNLPPYAKHTPCAQEGYSQMEIVTSDGQIIHGLNYTGWPDRDSNVASLLPDLILTCEKVIESGGLLVVYCEDGIERTEALLTACIIRRMVMRGEITKDNCMVQIHNLILSLRALRGSCFIRDPDQFTSLIAYAYSILDLPPASQEPPSIAALLVQPATAASAAASGAAASDALEKPPESHSAPPTKPEASCRAN